MSMNEVVDIVKDIVINSRNHGNSSTDVIPTVQVISDLLTVKLKPVLHKIEVLQERQHSEHRDMKTQINSIIDSLTQYRNDMALHKKTGLQNTGLVRSIGTQTRDTDETSGNIVNDVMSHDVAKETSSDNDQRVVLRRPELQCGRMKEPSTTSNVLKPTKAQSSQIRSDMSYVFNFPIQKLNNHLKPPDTFIQIKSHIDKIILDIIGPDAEFVGSVYEDLNVGQPYEFDIQWPIQGNFIFEKTGSKAAVNVYSGVKALITPEAARNHLQDKLMQKVTGYKLPTGWSWCDSNIMKSVVVHKKGFQLGFIFTGNRSKVGVLLDLIPFLNLPKQFVVENRFIDEKSLALLNHFICDQKGSDINASVHLVFDNTSWRVSTSLVEKLILNSKNFIEEYKEQYRVIKYFINTFIVYEDGTQFEGFRSLYGSNSMIVSYILKNELLKIILNQHEQLQSNPQLQPLIIDQIISRLESIYPTQGMKSVRHFLLKNHDVNIMASTEDGQKIALQLKVIKELFCNCDDTNIEKYPLINYPQVDIANIH